MSSERKVEIEMMTRPDDGQADDNILPPSVRELERFPVADGYVVMAELPWREIKFAAVGTEAWGKLQALLSKYRLSGLETYRMLGGDPEKAPTWLVAEQARRYFGNPRSRRPLPSIDEIASLSHPLLDTDTELGILGLACPEGDYTPCIDYFAHIFNTTSASWNQSIGGTWANVGNTSGYGAWSSGNADLILGPSSAGAAIVCFCEGVYDDPSNVPRVIVQERVGPGNWLDLWNDQSILYSGSALGIVFRGLTIRKIRVLVRDNEANTGKEFAWGGSYNRYIISAP